MPRPLLRMARVSWRDLATTFGPFVLVLVAAFALALHFIHPAPPRTVVMSAGRPGTIFQVTAERYRAILARQGVKLEIVPSEGSIENLHRLADPASKVDVAFVQGGLARLGAPDKVMSLGSVSYSPLAVFYRSPRPVERLSQFAGHRIAIGREGSGTRAIAETLLEANGIQAGGSTALVDLEGKDAADALVSGSVDAAFLMGDSASGASMMQLVRAPGVRLFDFVQADAYVRRFNYLSKIELPPGSLDLARNEPSKPLALVAATVELLARPGLHPAISDMLIEAAREVNGRATLLQKAGEFPAPLPREYRLSDDALRYYKSGKGLAYRMLPFWLASLVDRIVILLVPVLVVLLPGLKVVPMLYTWRVRERIYRRYGELMAIERAAFEHTTQEERTALVKRLDDFEERVIKMRLPSWWADELYVLRNHIAFVRRRLEAQASA